MSCLVKLKQACALLQNVEGRIGNLIVTQARLGFLDLKLHTVRWLADLRAVRREVEGDAAGAGPLVCSDVVDCKAPMYLDRVINVCLV